MKVLIACFLLIFALWTCAFLWVVGHLLTTGGLALPLVLVLTLLTVVYLSWSYDLFNYLFELIKKEKRNEKF